MKCFVKDCNNDAIDMHGISMVTHGYCYKHRTCGNCGKKIENECTCEEPKERIKFPSIYVIASLIEKPDQNIMTLYQYNTIAFLETEAIGLFMKSISPDTKVIIYTICRIDPSVLNKEGLLQLYRKEILVNEE